MIIATVQSHGFGKWAYLECDVLDCEWWRCLGPFAEPDKLADDMEEHTLSHRQPVLRAEPIQGKVLMLRRDP